MNGPEASKLIENLSAKDSRFLILMLQNHIESVEASMTPAELHEHLKEVPDDLWEELYSFYSDTKWKLRKIVADYVVRRGDWYREEYAEDYTDEEYGEFDRELVEEEFAADIVGLTDALMAEIFAPEEVDA